MNSYVLDILERLNDKRYRPGEEVIENTWESGKTISYAAMLEVQQLADETLLPELIRHFKQNPKDERRDHFLFLISSIVTNTLNKAGLNFMYELLMSTKNKQELEHCLGFYSHRVSMTPEYNLDPLIKLLAHRVEAIRISSYKAIANSSHPEKEELLINRLASLTRPYEIENALRALSQFCDNKHRKAIEVHLKSKSSRVREAAGLCIAGMNIRGGSGIESQLDKLPHFMQAVYKVKNNTEQ